MKHIRKFNESSTSDPNIDRFISIINKHYNEEDIEYLGQMNVYEYIENTISTTFDEMKNRLGEYSKYIFEGMMGGLLEDLMDEFERNIFSINGHLFKVSDSVLEVEHNLGRLKAQLSYDDEDKDFIESLKWLSGDDSLSGSDQQKLYSKWDQMNW